MHRKMKFFAILAFLGLILPGLAAASMGGAKMLKVGTPAPDFRYKTIEGDAGSLLQTAKGKPLLVVFLQTACGSCQREMQFLKEARAAEPELEILGIFIDVKEMDFKGYAKEHGLDFTFTWDDGYTIADSFGVAFAPASFLLDKEKNVHKVYRGWSKAGEELVNDFKEIKGK